MRPQLRIEESPTALAFLGIVEARFEDAEEMETSLLSVARAWAAHPDGVIRAAWIAWRGRACVGAALLNRAGWLDYAGTAEDCIAWATAFEREAAGIRQVMGELESVTALVASLSHRGWSWSRTIQTEVMATTAAPPRATFGFPGAYGAAVQSDVDTLSDWLVAFLAESGLDPVPCPSLAVSTLIARGDLFVWRVDGVPVSMVAVVARTRLAVRLSLVYSAPRFRRHGYARECMRAVTNELIAQGVHACCVHVRAGDVAAHSMYASLGYCRLGMRAEVSRAA